MANVLTCDDAYLGQRFQVLLSNRQVVPVVIEVVAAPAAPTWASVLAAGATTGGTAPIISGVTHLEFEGGGTGVARQGDLRVADGWSAWARTVGDSADRLMFQAASTFLVGDQIRPINVRGAGIVLLPAAGSSLSLTAGVAALSMPLLTWTLAAVTPTLTQVARSSGDGEQLTVAAQTTTAAAGVGGSLALQGGAGGAGGLGGPVVIQPGSGGTAGQTNLNHADGNTGIRLADNPGVVVGGQAINITATGLGFFDGTPDVRPSITGSRGGNAALASLISQLASIGLITDDTTA